MGLIMLILIGTVPAAYALNHAMGYSEVQDFAAVSQQAANVLGAHVMTGAVSSDPRSQLTDYIRTKEFTPLTTVSAQELALQIKNEIVSYRSLAKVPFSQQQNVRNDMYVQSEALRLMAKSGTPKFSAAENAVLANYKKHLDLSTKFIPSWVKVAVALALGLGTMVGWKRIVVTVGEKIGKQHLTYAQGASAEIVAMVTIGAADMYGLPVSTTHVLSSGVAGTMAANRSGLPWGTIRSLIMAWVLPLPMSIIIAGALYWLFRLLFSI